jgi:hypothetical protein
VNYIPRSECERGHAAQVSSPARAFQSVKHKDLSPRGDGRALLVNQNLDGGFGAVVNRSNRVGALVEPALGEVAGNGSEVRVAEKRSKRLQVPVCQTRNREF